MIYLIVRVKFQPAKESEFLETLGNEYIPMLREKYLWHLISSWKIQVGDLHEIMNIWKFNDLGEFWANREGMFHDKIYMDARQRLHSLMVEEHISFATALPYSPI